MHLTQEHLQKLSSRKQASPEQPLFPTAEGKFPEKETVVRSVEMLATLLGVIFV